MPVKHNKLAPGFVRCSMCRGDFPKLISGNVGSCTLCPVDPKAFAPRHFSSDACQSGGPRQHANCIGRHGHCTCDRCF